MYIFICITILSGSSTDNRHNLPLFFFDKLLWNEIVGNLKVYCFVVNVCNLWCKGYTDSVCLKNACIHGKSVPWILPSCLSICMQLRLPLRLVWRKKCICCYNPIVVNYLAWSEALFKCQLYSLYWGVLSWEACEIIPFQSRVKAFHMHRSCMCELFCKQLCICGSQTFQGTICWCYSVIKFGAMLVFVLLLMW